MTFDWDGWKRRDWDGQRLLELFQEFGFRGFADRVRKTLTNERREEERRGARNESGAGSAVAAAERAARAGETKPTARPRATPKKAGPQPVRPDRRRRREAPPARRTQPPDDWKYDGYELVDTPKAFDAFLEEAEEAEAVRLRPGNDRPRPAHRTRSSATPSAGSRTEAYYLPSAARGGRERSTRTRRSRRSSRSSRTRRSRRSTRTSSTTCSCSRRTASTLAGVAGDPMVAHYLLARRRADARPRRPDARPTSATRTSRSPS